jgi:hypothetical protein
VKTIELLLSKMEQDLNMGRSAAFRGKSSRNFSSGYSGSWREALRALDDYADAVSNGELLDFKDPSIHVGSDEATIQFVVVRALRDDDGRVVVVYRGPAEMTLARENGAWKILECDLFLDALCSGSGSQGMQKGKRWVDRVRRGEPSPLSGGGGED